MIIDKKIRRLALCTFAWCAALMPPLALCNKAQAAPHCPPAARALTVADSTLCLIQDGATPAKLKIAEQAWIERSAHIVAAYYGQFPAPLVVLQLGSSGGSGVNGGRTTNDDGLMIQATVGARHHGRGIECGLGHGA